jgi:hypothetical protein
MRGRSISVLVTFSSDTSRKEIYDYFDSFEDVWFTEISNTMMKRYSVECPEEKILEYVLSFKSSPNILSAIFNNNDLNRKGRKI